MKERPSPRIGDTVRVLHEIPELGVMDVDYATLESVDGDSAVLAFFHCEKLPLPDGKTVRGTVPLSEVVLWCRAPESRGLLRKVACLVGLHDDVREENVVTGNCGGLLIELGRINHCTSCGQAIGY